MVLADATAPPSGKQSTNFYAAAKNNPEVLERRKQRVAQLDTEVAGMARRNPGRTPDWEEERVMRMDLAALEHGKRCVMWDDQGAGFYLMLNWDWVRNLPAAPPLSDDSSEPGWWHNAREMLRPPLLDPSLSDRQLAAWIDARTMRVHARLLQRLPSISAGPRPGWCFVLPPDDEYYARLLALAPPRTATENSLC